MALDEELTRLIVNLTPRSLEALGLTAGLTEMRRTDLVNRAIQLQWALSEAAEKSQRTGKPVGLYVLELLGDEDDRFDITVTSWGVDTSHERKGRG